MLYINKTNAPARVNMALAKIKSTPEWRAIYAGDTATIRAQFDTLPKTDIRMALLQEQRHLCAYCMKRIRNEELHMTIEHWMPLSKNKDKALDYNNFLGVCKGGSDVLVEGKRILCCDASKGDEDQMVINPLNTLMMEQIAYRKDGTIYFMDSLAYDVETTKQIEKDINVILRLNGKRDSKGNLIADTSTCLLKGRRDACRQAIAKIELLAKKRVLSSRRLKNEIKKMQELPQLPEFAGTTLFFLNRTYKALVAQGK